MKLKPHIAAIILLLIPVTVFAQATFRKEISDKFVFDIAPGAKINHQVTVINVGDKPAEIQLYATDGIVTSTGGFSTMPKVGKQEGVGKWLKFKDPKVTLDVNEQKLVPFEIIIPEGTTPGSYAGGISMEPAAAASKVKLTGAVVSTRIVMPLFVKVQGTRVSAYEWSDFKHVFERSHNFTLSFANKGNTIIKITGDIILKDITDNEIVIPIGDITLLQKEASTISVPWAEKPFFGKYTATANLRFQEFDLQSKRYIELEKLTKTLDFMVIPWNIIFMIIGLVILLIIMIIFKKIARKNYLKKCLPYTVVAGDTLTGLGTKFSIDWNKLAKMNGLKPPYDLPAGRKILLPPKK